MDPIQHERRKRDLLIVLEVEFPEKSAAWRENLAEQQLRAEDAERLPRRLKEFWDTSLDGGLNLLPWALAILVFVTFFIIRAAAE